MFTCPGCDQDHVIKVEGKPPVWEWNGCIEKPTISPSLRVRFGDNKVCHSFIKGGFIQFLDDCTHKLAGLTVPLLDMEG
ncbi:MAG: anaerobic dehydrogenase [Deltaproteobacteria bacterium]|nr:anaerobic dehydrogenase [Deltaproteobacteria bacterium]